MKPSSSNLVTHEGPSPAEEYSLPPVWLQRLAVAVYVLLCMTLGMALVTLPWLGNWFEDGLVARWPALQHLLQLGFVRGAVSGLGLIDIWLGIMEAVRYQDRRPPTASAPTQIDGNITD